MPVQPLSSENECPPMHLTEQIQFKIIRLFNFIVVMALSILWQVHLNQTHNLQVNLHRFQKRKAPFKFHSYQL